MHFSCPFVVVKMRGWPLANDDPKGLASCKWSSGGASLLQMMIRRAAAVRGGIGDSSSWMDFFLCKICFLTSRLTLHEAIRYIGQLKALTKTSILLVKCQSLLSDQMSCFSGTAMYFSLPEHSTLESVVPLAMFS